MIDPRIRILRKLSSAIATISRQMPDLFMEGIIGCEMDGLKYLIALLDLSEDDDIRDNISTSLFRVASKLETLNSLLTNIVSPSASLSSGSPPSKPSKGLSRKASIILSPGGVEERAASADNIRTTLSWLTNLLSWITSIKSWATEINFTDESSHPVKAKDSFMRNLRFANIQKLCVTFDSRSDFEKSTLVLKSALGVTYKFDKSYVKNPNPILIPGTSLKLDYSSISPNWGYRMNIATEFDKNMNFDENRLLSADLLDDDFALNLLLEYSLLSQDIFTKRAAVRALSN